MKIVVRQISGLGNQLFQYAAGRYFAERYGASIRIAVDPPRNAVSHGYARPFLLSHFAIPATMSTLTWKERLLLSTKPALRRTIGAVSSLLGTQVVAETAAQRYQFVEDLPVAANTHTLYLAGYWQAHRFADSIAGALRADLHWKSPASGKNLDRLKRIQDCAAPVSLHVRRGDYTLAAEGNLALPLAYYEAAITHFRQRLHNPVFFVFSDDIAFARANLPKDIQAVFVDHNDDSSAQEDLRLMAACHHHAIANSSFSWWGAWLNPRLDKTVFAPRYWHKRPDSYFPDLLPSDWTLGIF